MTVQYFAFIRDITGCKQEECPAAPDMRTLLRELSARHGDALRQKLYAPGSEEPGEIILMINGRHIAHLGDLDATLKDSDTVQVFPMVAGG